MPHTPGPWEAVPEECDNLIAAAAPEMLAALTLCEDFLVRDGHSDDDSTRGGVALKSVRIAIAKAKGK